MCLILVVWRVHPDYPCVIAANRDEFHRRPTAVAQWWSDAPQILAGRDLEAGGTWLGVNRRGRFAALTNFRGAPAKAVDAPSRGEIVASMLRLDRPVDVEIAAIARVSPQYNAFNVIFSDGERLGIFESTTGSGRALGAGIYGLSNHLLDTPWPKLVKAKSRLGEALEHLPRTDRILELLRDDETVADAELPRTGVSPEWERLLSSAFIRSAEYGTRCSTIVSIDRAGTVRFDEWTWNSEGAETDRVRHRFSVDQ